MKAEELWDNYGISDYHRLQYLGDNVDDILYILLKNIHVGVGLFEVGDMIQALYLNEAFFTCIGYTVEEYMEHISDIYSTLVSEDVDGFKECIMTRSSKGENIDYVVRGYRKDGSIGWFNVSGVMLENKIGESPIYLTAVSDISDKKDNENKIIELKEANEQVKLLEERYKILEGTAQGLLFEYNPKKDTMVFSYNFPNNKKRREIENYSEYSKHSPIVHSSFIEVFREALMNACNEEVDDSLEYLSSISGGGYRWHRTFYKSILGMDGTVSSVIGRIMDIHDEKMKQEMLNYKADMDGLPNFTGKRLLLPKCRNILMRRRQENFILLFLIWMILRKLMTNTDISMEIRF